MKKWVKQIFDSQIAKRGGIVRRKIKSIDKQSSRQELTAECGKLGYHIIEHGDQWLIFCDKAKVSLIL